MRYHRRRRKHCISSRRGAHNLGTYNKLQISRKRRIATKMLQCQSTAAAKKEKMMMPQVRHELMLTMLGHAT